ncbi:E3 ubiquitin-protein ligase ZNRF2 [Arapaima gigas]
MGAKQSSPAANGRTRAYSGSDLPSGPSATNGGAGSAAPGALRYSAYGASAQAAPTSGTQHTASRTRSTGPGARPQSSINIPTSGSQESGSSSPEESAAGDRGRAAGPPRLLIGSLPAHLSPHLFGGFKCPVCSKFVSSDEMDLHLVMCLTKPRVTYNEDILTKDAEECAICLEQLVQGDTIARLPCLCIYHKGCIDEWFEVNRSCPEHPAD